MLKNYLTITLRSLRRQPGYAFINILGLAIGLAACVLIMLWVQDELAYDRSHDKADRIVRVVEARESAEGEQHYAYTSGALGTALVESYPEVERSVRAVSRNMTGRLTVEHGEAQFYSGEHLFVEQSFFDVFDFGTPGEEVSTALVEPNTVVLTQDWAERLYGEANPVGEALQVPEIGDFTVTAVIRDQPANSHLRFNMLFSLATLESFDGWNRWLSNWESDGVVTYLVLRDGANMDALSAQLPAFVSQHREDPIGEGRRTYLQALPDIHFGSAHIEFEVHQGKSSRSYVFIFSAIALFIVLIACINYMNLATARSIRRAREVGLRKVVGANRGQLIRQFLGESMLVTSLAVLLSIGLVSILLPSFNTLADKELSIDLTNNWVFAIGLLLLVLGVGLAAGSYPAFYLSRFRPSQVLKETGATGGALWLRRGLVVTQFALSITMIVATLVVYRQMDYVQSRQPGFDEAQLVVIDINNGDVRRDFETVKREISAVPRVQSVSVSSRVPGDWKPITQIEMLPTLAADDARIGAHFIGVDADFLDTFGLNVASGRNFSDDFTTDSTSVLLNKSAADRLGVGVGDAVRVPAEFLWQQYQDDDFQAQVAGIVEDFHFESLHLPIGPLLIGYRTSPIDVIDYFTARIDGSDVPATIEALQAIGERFDPSHPFEYNFLSERMADFYERESRLSTLFAIAAALAVAIACLGLFGLAAFTAEQRTKEIGIRKLLGASVPGLVGLLSGQFVRLVGVAFVIAVPVAWLVMRRWLEAFAYRVDISWALFAAAGLAVLLAALVTVGIQAIRAAQNDPVKSLRYE